MNKMTETAPKRIYLQIADGGEEDSPFPYGEEVTWCEDSVMCDEVEYVRADLAVAPLMQAKVPKGRKLVPIEPTGAMLLNCVGICRSAEDASRAYKAMLAAAPEVQS
jgi:hypothetical protein